MLIKVGQGVYVKAKKSVLTGNIVPKIDLPEIGKALLKKMSVKVLPSRYEMWYNEGKTTQVSSGKVIAISGVISRKLGLMGFI